MNRTIANLADLGIAGDPAIEARSAELNALVSALLTPSPALIPSSDSIVANKLFIAWTSIYGERADWPKNLNAAYETLLANVGLSSFRAGLEGALQNLRAKAETTAAFHAALDVIGAEKKFSHIAAEFNTTLSSGIIPESSAAAGLEFVGNPANLVLPIYGGMFAGRFGGLFASSLGGSLTLAGEAAAGIGTVASLLAESAGFMAAAHVVARSVSGEAIPRNVVLTELGSTTLFFGMLRVMDRGTNLLTSLVPMTKTGIAAVRTIGHAGAVTSLAAAEELQEKAGIAPVTSEDFGARIWRSLFLYATLAATRGVISGPAEGPNVSYRIVNEALSMIRSMRFNMAPSLLAPLHHFVGGQASREGRGIFEMRSVADVRGSRPAAMPPPPPPLPVRKQWGVYVVQVPGHGLAPDYAKMDNQLAVQGTTSEAHIVLRSADGDGRLRNRYAQTVDNENNGLFDEYASGPEASRHLGKNILDANALASFLTEAAEQFPADKIAVSFEGHSGDLRRSIPEIHKALAALKAKTGRNIDLILFDSCFMAQIEIATEFSDAADYMNASQEGVVTFRSFPRISRFIAKDGVTTPEELATEIALNNKEFTFSAIDLKKLAGLNQAIKVLGEMILAVDNHSAFSAIRKAMRDATGYYTEGLFSHNHFSNTVDLKGFIRGIYRSRFLRENFPYVTKAAIEVLKAFGKEGEGVIVKERHASKTDQYYLDFTDVRGSYGLSIHQRITPKWLWNAYTHLKDSVFNRVTGWDKVTDHITSDRTALYNVESALRFLGGAITAGVNNGIQRVVEMWKTFWFTRNK